MLNELIKNTKNKSENQMKTLVQTILPRIALYKILSEEDFSEEMSEKGAFITGSDFLIDGGATALYYYGKLKPETKE